MPNRRLVVLISGWTKTDLAWYLIEKRFKEMGYDVIRAVYSYRGLTPIQYSARAVGPVIEAVRPEYDHCTVIGHSMGGLIGRYLLQRSPWADCFDAYVSIGTPHQGTVLANLGSWFSKSAAQMATGSDFLKRLNDTPWPERVPALAVHGGWEEIVLPRRNAKIDFGENIEIPFATHVSIILDPRTFWEIWGWMAFNVFDEDPIATQHEGISTTLDLS